MDYTITNAAWAKLLNILGTPSWYTRVTLDDKVEPPVLKLYTNPKPPKEELDRIPESINGILVEIYYRPTTKL
jgi:hypothetical protein